MRFVQRRFPDVDRDAAEQHVSVDLSPIEKAKSGARFAGIGSRETPSDVLELFTALGRVLVLRGLWLRSGCAQGADAAFERGARVGARARALAATGDPPAAAPWELYLPWPTFQGKGERDIGGGLSNPTPAAYALAAKVHPTWERCSTAARKLHARNGHQILGADLAKPRPAAFVVCYTTNGLGQGGTGQALRIAKKYEIPVFDAGIPEVRDALTVWWLAATS